ncbi:hypothetical protein RSAG8_03046, partial [Rhizoctonia solani AG-8 WAC10335]
MHLPGTCQIFQSAMPVNLDWPTLVFKRRARAWPLRGSIGSSRIKMFGSLVSVVLGSCLIVSAFPSEDLVSRVPKLTTLGAKCGKSAAISCRNATVQEDLCCFNAPGGQFLLTQFWDFSPAAGPNDSWTIHGLWPDHCDGTYDANCAPERELFNITTVLEQSGQQKLLKYMNKYWLNNNGTNEEFWEHEYNKHGTCISTLEPQCFKKSKNDQFPELVTYISKTVELFQDLPTYKWLKAKGIVPSTTTTYTLSQIREAIVTKTVCSFTPLDATSRATYLRCGTIMSFKALWVQGSSSTLPLMVRRVPALRLASSTSPRALLYPLHNSVKMNLAQS